MFMNLLCRSWLEGSELSLDTQVFWALAVGIARLVNMEEPAVVLLLGV